MANYQKFKFFFHVSIKFEFVRMQISQTSLYRGLEISNLSNHEFINIFGKSFLSFIMFVIDFELNIHFKKNI